MFGISERELKLAAKMRPKEKRTFAAAWKLLNAFQRSTDKLLDTQSDPKLVRLKTVLMAIGIDCIRKYRSILALCEIGQIDNAQILARCVFESLLAVRFILLPRPRKYNLPVQPRTYSAREFRAILYSVAVGIKAAKLAETTKVTKGAKRMLNRAVVRGLQANASEAEAEIGKAWFDRIRQSKSFSGLSVYDMAVHAGLQQDYLGLYGRNSIIVHAGDSMEHLELDGTVARPRIDLDFAGAAAPLGTAGWYAGSALIEIGQAVGIEVDSIVSPAYKKLIWIIMGVDRLPRTRKE